MGKPTAERAHSRNRTPQCRRPSRRGAAWTGRRSESLMPGRRSGPTNLPLASAPDPAAGAQEGRRPVDRWCAAGSASCASSASYRPICRPWSCPHTARRAHRLLGVVQRPRQVLLGHATVGEKGLRQRLQLDRDAAVAHRRLERGGDRAEIPFALGHKCAVERVGDPCYTARRACYCRPTLRCNALASDTPARHRENHRLPQLLFVEWWREQVQPRDQRLVAGDAITFTPLTLRRFSNSRAVSRCVSCACL